MIVPGSLPQWDEAKLLRSKLDSAGGHTGNPNAHAVLPDPVYARTCDDAAPGTLAHIMDVFSEILKDTQSYHRPSPSADSWRVSFPFAIYLKKGDPIRNLTTGDTYKIEEILDVGEGDVRLSGKTAPTRTNRLRLDEKNLLYFNHGFPRSFVNSMRFDPDSEISDTLGAYNEGIHWVVKKSSPTAPGVKEPFTMRAYRPFHMEDMIDDGSPGKAIQIRAMLFEHLVLFDCWTKNNRRAEELANWLEDTILRSQWILNSFGSARVFFWGREEEEEIYRFRSDMTKRTVVLYVQTQRHTLSSSTRIRTVETNVTFSADIEEDTAQSNVILQWPGTDETAGGVTAEIVE